MTASTTMKTANPLASLSGSHRRAQPVRQTRANPPRASIPRAGPGARNGHGGHESESGPICPSAFFPAITHFTDSISALPREVIRHFSLLKEVDSKIYGPEETLAQLTDLGLRTPLPALRQIVTNGAVVEARKDDRAVAVGQSKGVVISDHGSITTSEPPTQFAVNEASDTTRRHIFLNLRYVLSEMMMTIDEKNHVIATANEALQKQLARMDSSYPYIENEVSEEARLGSLRHWAYNDKSLTRINGASGPADRSRRDIAAANSLAAAAAAMEEVPATKADKRDAAPAKRSRKPAQIESDVDDEHLGRPRDSGAALTSNPTPAPKKSHAKVRKPVEPAAVGMGLGITNGLSALGNPPNKRRRTEKVSNGEMAAGVVMDRSISGAFSNHAHVGKGKAGSPREIPVAEGGRKRNRGGNGGNGGVSSTIVRKRINTSTATIQSSSIASSPIQSTFPPTNDSHRAPTEHPPLPRPQSSRARKNSAQSLPPDNGVTTARQSSVSATSGRPPPDDHTSVVGPADLAAAGSSIGRSVPEVKSLLKESSTTQGERLSEEHQHSREDDYKGALVIVTSTNGGRAKEGAAAPKCEETVNHTVAVPHGQSSHGIRNTTITTNSRKASKQSTPVTATFTEKNRQSRPSRAQGTVTNTTNAEHAGSMKRSHKKGAGAAAAQQQQQLQQMQQQQQQTLQLHHVTSTILTPGTRDEEAGSMQGDEEDEEDEDTSGQKYCFCNQVSYGEMVACDADGCRVEWFHLGCVGLTKAPTKNAKWYCDECKEKLRNGRVHGGGGR